MIAPIIFVFKALAPILWRIVGGYGSAIAMGVYTDSFLIGCAVFIAFAVAFPMDIPEPKNGAIAW